MYCTGNASVPQFFGGSSGLTCETVYSTGNTGISTSIAIDANDKPHILFFDESSSGSNARYCNKKLILNCSLIEDIFTQYPIVNIT